MTEKKTTAEIEITDADEWMNIFGRNDVYLKMIQERSGVVLVHRNGVLEVKGSAKAVMGVERLVKDLRSIHRRGRHVERDDVQYALMLLEERGGEKEAGTREFHLVDGHGRAVRPRSPMQQTYVESIAENDVVFGIGPAGTGKTFLAVACAVQRLLEHRVQRIIVCRPAVEAGEKLGFLPGDMQQKVDPYLRPIYDALFGLMQPERAAKLLERGSIEVAPLAYMRGRTLEAAFTILDEAQNTTVEQMKMFLTRLGRGSNAVITGDVTQIDLPPDKVCGLIDAADRFRDIPGITVVRFSKKDVVRHDLVGRVIEAYETNGGPTEENADGDSEEKET